MPQGDGAHGSTASSAGQLGTLTWPQLWDASPRPVLVVPVGSCEQHGPHLPLDTDTRIAVALAQALTTGAPDAACDISVAPAIAIGASGEHAGFPGTLSIGTDVLRQVLIEVGRSADWSAGVVFVNGHGGNHESVRDAVATLEAEGRRALAWSPRIPGGDAHAGRSETSLLLAIAPDVVRLHDAVPGNTAPLASLIGALRADGVVGVSANGVLGDPTGANADEGTALLGTLAADFARAVAAWRG